MTTALDFYFDFSSPYGYLAAHLIDQLAAKYQRTVNWHPILLGAIFKKTESVPLLQIPVKGDYALHDIMRSARFYGIPYQHPSVFPLSTQAAARAVLWLGNTQGEVRAIAFAKLIYQAYFMHDVRIDDPLALCEIVQRYEIDAADLIAGISTDTIKAQLKAEVAAALEHGVFGSPFVIADGEAFWGVDRFNQLDVFLRDGKI